ncbi:(2Fe-2S)-binding protein [Chondromyces apiculatus]|uniref:4-hydroxybenzoyl-CoA reductase, gamma subunit n=1 Tax=Chondromyces apiculatus DSM 436 TaxID=1192034 RepID=A0A017TK14_9BACT|nr:(2Fe-2S)-binding protein [Chondromyces apiculatus]EYF08991.1 4-hydroxybenzoyl-CoA reductase, gamma subunit [Chondromyces apiculatus DSM 436]
MKISFKVNGAARELDAPPLQRLLDALRLVLGLTGTKEGCAEGECGACTVLLDGEPVNACLVPVGQCQGREITTVEGLGAAGHLSPLQRCFIDHGGAQCGICTPGVLISAEHLLRRNPDPDDDAIREALAGNLCRCTGYQRIIESVRAAAVLRRADARDVGDPRDVGDARGARDVSHDRQEAP